MDDRGISALHELLNDGGKGPRPKAEVLEALALRPVWLATWEPRAEGFRTLINPSGEEALAVFSSEGELKAAAERFDWLGPDGNIATHRAIGGDIFRHAYTREYAFVVIDVGSGHSLEYARDELKKILREMDVTGPFKTSRPPPAPEKPAASSSFPAPEEGPISTTYSMGPSEAEKLERLSDIPTQPHSVPYDSEPPTQPRAAVSQDSPPSAHEKGQSSPPDSEPPTQPRAAVSQDTPASAHETRKSSRPAHKPKSDPPGTKIEEIATSKAELGEGGTYGAASIMPMQEQPKTITPSMVVGEQNIGEPHRRHPVSSTAPKLASDAPTAPAAHALPSMEPGKLKLPEVGPLGVGSPPSPPSPTTEAKSQSQPAAKKVEAPRTPQPSRLAGPSIGDGIQLAEMRERPNKDLLKSLADVLRSYFEVEWASYCEVHKPGGNPGPAVGLRIADNYRDNVTAIIKDLTEASRKQKVELDVLLIDGHDMLRKARERGFVFYPWKPKQFA